MENYERLLEIVKNEDDLEEYLTRKGHAPADAGEVTSEPDYQALYHLSKIRQNVLNWYEFDPAARLLELGAECGALSGLFAERVAEVVAFDSDKDKCAVNRARNIERFSDAEDDAKVTNLYVVSNPEYIAKPEKVNPETKSDKNKSDKTADKATKIKSAITKTKNAITRKGSKFDYVTIVGDFTEEKLELATEYLKTKGQLIIVVDNKFGLKNWTTEAKPDIISKERIVSLTAEKKLKLTATYYPVPDYKFPLEIYSDQNPPKSGSIRTAAPEFEKDKTLLMDEPTAFSEMIESGRFDEYANSYILIFEKKTTRSK